MPISAQKAKGDDRIICRHWTDVFLVRFAVDSHGAWWKPAADMARSGKKNQFQFSFVSRKMFIYSVSFKPGTHQPFERP